jgi:beta-phosphoglucomutase-like phosphatase (HAD superfamily)
MFSLVIFDCDGVLVDSELITNRVFAAMINELGVPVTLEDRFEKFVGRFRTPEFQSMSKLQFSSGMTVVFLTNLWPR